MGAPAWETIPGGLNNGRYDVSIGSMTITPERQQTLNFSDPYYYTSGQVFVKKGGTQITGVADLAGKKVGVGAATTYYDYLKKNSEAIVKTYTTDADTFPDLLNGNIDFVMTAGPTGQQAILEGKPMEFSGKPLYYEDLAMAVKKGETDWTALLIVHRAADARERCSHRDVQAVVQRHRPDREAVAYDAHGESFGTRRLTSRGGGGFFGAPAASHFEERSVHDAQTRRVREHRPLRRAARARLDRSLARVAGVPQRRARRPLHAAARGHAHRPRGHPRPERHSAPSGRATRSIST